MPRKYAIETFGCQMNVHDSERVAGALDHAGLVPAASAADADVVVINTCSVRERAEDKLFSRLGELRATGAGKSRVVAVTGCVAQQRGAAIAARAWGVDVVAGTQALARIPELIEKAALSQSREPLVDIDPYENVAFPLGVVRRSDPVKAYVTVIEGCNDYCAFCVVPYTRGHERMRPIADILREIRHAAAAGHREIHLLGQIVNHYEAPDDEGCDFALLLERVSEIEGVARIRFASPHPRHVTPRLIAAIRDLPKVCKHVHLPVQSGSTRVLAAMRRRHTRDQYLDLVARIRGEVPDVALSTDVIVGFPGETEADFHQSLSLVEHVRFDGMFSFKYSPRPGTLARQRMPDDVAEGEKTRRLQALQGLQQGIQLEKHRAQVGLTVRVLVDSTSRKSAQEMSGRTTGNTVVNLAGERTWLGCFADVLVEGAGPNSLRGRAVWVEPAPAHAS